jgi:hypothetical protein
MVSLGVGGLFLMSEVPLYAGAGMSLPEVGRSGSEAGVQRYLAHKKHPPRMTLQ